MGRLVWAFEPLEETGGETGFVELADEALAERLIDAGKVQCGWNPEGGEFRYVDSKALAAYATRQLKAGSAEARPPDPAPAEELQAEPAPERKPRGRPPKAAK